MRDHKACCAARLKRYMCVHKVNNLPHEAWRWEAAVQLLSLNSLQGPVAHAKAVGEKSVNVLAIHQVSRVLSSASVVPEISPVRTTYTSTYSDRLITAESSRTGGE